MRFNVNWVKVTFLVCFTLSNQCGLELWNIILPNEAIYSTKRRFMFIGHKSTSYLPALNLMVHLFISLAVIKCYSITGLTRSCTINYLHYITSVSHAIYRKFVIKLAEAYKETVVKSATLHFRFNDFVYCLYVSSEQL